MLYQKKVYDMIIATKKSKKIINPKKSKKFIKPKKSDIAIVRVGPAIVDYLPIDAITEIVARVGATSAADLFRCKLTCKILHEIVEEKKVLQHAAIKGLYYCTWSNKEKAQSYFDRCRNCNNPDALYQLGMEQYFSQFKAIEGMKNLEKAMTQKHKEATYAIGLISMCSSDNKYKNKGVELLLNLMNTIKGEGIIELRQKLRDLMHELRWRIFKNEDTNEVSSLMVPPTITCTLGALHEIESGWAKEYYYDENVEDNVVCEACKCRREVDFFHDLLRTILVPLDE
ncbi:hypothetical protein RND81_08G201700 [Saponaria officinalis]|uniref:F-box domain-containing protein n=1 Tax=Saponaria officinalis TaxID=3572 RepID=A0AAW1JAH8_SAPOF